MTFFLRAAEPGVGVTPLDDIVAEGRALLDAAAVGRRRRPPGCFVNEEGVLAVGPAHQLEDGVEMGSPRPAAAGWGTGHRDPDVVEALAVEHATDAATRRTAAASASSPTSPTATSRRARPCRLTSAEPPVTAPSVTKTTPCPAGDSRRRCSAPVFFV
jgi:hypothetical protein